MREATDAELIKRSLKDPPSFEAVFARHYESVRAFAERLVGATDGEEIAAQTFEIAFAIRARFDSESFASARPWLMGIANNIARHHFRSERTRLDAAKRATVELAEESAFRPEAEDARRQGPALRDALDRLDPDTRETFLLFALAELSYDEVAQVLNVPKGTVRSRIHRARSSLRELFDPEGATKHGAKKESP